MNTKNIQTIPVVKRGIILTVLSWGLFSCTPDATYVPVDDRIGALPETVIDPEDNPRTPEKIELGRLLFWDPILSGNMDVACVTCHHPDNGYAERIDLSLGVGAHGLSENRTGGILVKRNAPTIINTAFNSITAHGTYDPSQTFLFLDNRSASLEIQALAPIRSLEEMRGDGFDIDEIVNVVANRLANIPEYAERFDAVFGEGTVIDGDKISKAIAAFERSIIANNSRFDQYARGDETAMNAEEIRGMQAFVNAKCTACHSGPMFSDYELHDLGVPDNPKLSEIDEGLGGRFRTLSLRNLSETGPYFHNGMLNSLEDAVNFYNRFERNDADAQQLDFDGDLTGPIVAFLKALNDPNFDRSIPASVPSGLPVGGNIH